MATQLHGGMHTKWVSGYLVIILARFHLLQIFCIFMMCTTIALKRYSNEIRRRGNDRDQRRLHMETSSPVFPRVNFVICPNPS